MLYGSQLNDGPLYVDSMAKNVDINVEPSPCVGQPLVSNMGGEGGEYVRLPRRRRIGRLTVWSLWNSVVSMGRHKPRRTLDTPGRSRLSAFRTAGSSRSSTRPLCKRCTASSATGRPPCTRARQHPPDGTSFPRPFSRTTYRHVYGCRKSLGTRRRPDIRHFISADTV